MISEQELNEKIQTVCNEFSGQIDDLQAAIGLLVVGRLYGWRVMRLVCPKRHWTVAKNLFGDPKQLLPERGVLAHKSNGLLIIEQIGGYWEYIKGHTNRDEFPVTRRNEIC